MSDTSQPDFSLLLASSVHDIKNSLGMLINSLDEAITATEDETPAQRKRYSILRGEAARINHAMIHLLGLYRLQHEQLTLNLEEVFVADFLEEQLASQELLLEVNNINATVECDDNLAGFFDEPLVAGIVSNILVNCAKYTRDHISLQADKRDNYLCITITDNGNGYPPKIIDSLDNDGRSIDFSSGSTNLGLYFAREIAAMHHCKGRRGFIELSNLDSGGGCFKLYLP